MLREWFLSLRSGFVCSFLLLSLFLFLDFLFSWFWDPFVGPDPSPFFAFLFRSLGVALVLVIFSCLFLSAFSRMSPAIPPTIGASATGCTIDEDGHPTPPVAQIQARIRISLEIVRDIYYDIGRVALRSPLSLSLLSFSKLAWLRLAEPESKSQTDSSSESEKYQLAGDTLDFLIL